MELPPWALPVSARPALVLLRSARRASGAFHSPCTHLVWAWLLFSQVRAGLLEQRGQVQDAVLPPPLLP